jgi:hypothetical protein
MRVRLHHPDHGAWQNDDKMIVYGAPHGLRETDWVDLDEEEDEIDADIAFLRDAERRIEGRPPPRPRRH